ncbi:MAG: hypothetical protein Q8N99_07955 [Nanoarchaeota archaeon]|nr:hypothetical protein [Nanoarchaeota archaeon]
MDRYLLVPFDMIDQVRDFLNRRMWPCRLSEFVESFPDFPVVDSSEIPRGQRLRCYAVGFNNSELSVYRNHTIDVK